MTPDPALPNRPDLPAYLLEAVEAESRSVEDLRALARYADALADQRATEDERESRSTNEPDESDRPEKPAPNGEQEAALRDDRPVDVPSKAGLVMKHINGNWYYYWQYREKGKDSPTQDYAGPVNPRS